MAGGSPQAGGSPTGGGGGGGGGGDGGSGGGAAGTEVLETTSTERVVTAELDAADQALARVGRAATVTLPSGRTVRGRIVEVGTVATAGDDEGGGAGGGDGSATLPVTIRLRSARGAGGLDEAPVSVALARTTRRNVLAVPVQALVARSGGGYAVRVVRRSATGGSVEVPVEPGLYADGWVELLDGDVRAGDRVEVPR
jgi:multidrug efflux pump subunit AcrA (membrane-fusion protein)